MIDKEKIDQIEKIFRSAVSSDELFDAFREALGYKINDIEVFKILIANPFLTEDEIMLFVEKLVKEFENGAFDICMWTGEVFISRSDPDHFENALKFFNRAVSICPAAYHPFISMINLYNPEYDLPINQNILEIINGRIETVQFKSKVYYALADLYKQLGKLEKEAKYLALAEKSLEKERL